MAFTFNAILKFNASQATKKLNEAGQRFNRFRGQVAKMGKQLSKVGQGVRGLAIATAPVAIGLGLATKEAADFEAQMSITQSVLLATKKEMKPLVALTKRLGATTAFTAVESGLGAEALSRAGFKMHETMAALPSVLDAAAASGMGLGETATLVADNIRAFALDASQAGVVADGLALTSAITNTNMTQLGEGLKFAAPLARQAGFSFSETASAIGVLSNAGIKGTLAGTAFKNALNKLAKPTKEAIALFGGSDGMDKALFRIVDGVKKLRPFEEIMANISLAIADSPDKLAQVRNASELLGLRGTGAFSSFSAQIQRTTEITEKNFEMLKKGAKISGESIKLNLGGTIPTLVAIRLQIAGAEGTARKMASIRLDNLTGQFTLFKSATSGVAIEMGSLVTGPLRKLLSVGTDALSLLASAFQLLNAEGDETKAIMDGLANNQFKHLIESAQLFAQGFIDGFAEVKAMAFNAFDSISKFLKPFLDDLSIGPKELGRMVSKFGLLAAIAAPVLAAMAAAGIVLVPLFVGLSGALGFVSTAFSIIAGVIGFLITPIGLLAIGIGAVGFAIFQWMGGMEGIKNTFATFKEGFMATFSPKLFSSIGFGVKVLGNALSELFGVIFEQGDTAGNDWSTFGKVIGVVANVIVGALSLIINSISLLLAGLTKIATIGVGKLKSVASFFGFGGNESKSISTAFSKADSANEAGRGLGLSESEGVAVKNARLAEQSLRSKSTAIPPSARENAAAAASQSSGGGGRGASGSFDGPNIKVVIESKGDLKAILNKAVTKARIENSERNGDSRKTGKRKIQQNGLALNN